APSRRESRLVGPAGQLVLALAAHSTGFQPVEVFPNTPIRRAGSTVERTSQAHMNPPDPERSGRLTPAVSSSEGERGTRRDCLGDSSGVRGPHASSINAEA